MSAYKKFYGQFAKVKSGEFGQVTAILHDGEGEKVRIGDQWYAVADVATLYREVATRTRKAKAVVAVAKTTLNGVAPKKRGRPAKKTVDTQATA